MAMFKFGKKEEKKVPTCSCGMGGDGKVSSVKVLGSGCSSCHALYESVQAAVRAMGLDVEVEYITDLQRIMEYGVMSMPALVVDGKVVASGRVLKPSDVQEVLKGSPI